MTQYLIRRLLIGIPTLFLVSVLIFAAMRVIPGDELSVLFGQEEGAAKISDELREQLLADLGLDKPIWVQYGMWMGEVATGRMGSSFWRDESVGEVIARRGPISAQVAVLAVLFSYIIGLPVGILCAVKQDTWMDYVGRVMTINFLAIPNFWLGTLVLVGMIIYFDWMPPLEWEPFWVTPWTSLKQSLVPALIMGSAQAATVARMSRSSLLEVMREDYIRTSRAKGLSERITIYRHALRNAIIPVITISSVSLGFLLGGSVVIERVFQIPGLGLSMIEAVQDRDFVVVQNLVLLYAFIFVGINFLVDVLYAMIDPRIRYN